MVNWGGPARLATAARTSRLDLPRSCGAGGSGAECLGQWCSWPSPGLGQGGLIVTPLAAPTITSGEYYSHDFFKDGAYKSLLLS